MIGSRAREVDGWGATRRTGGRRGPDAWSNSPDAADDVAVHAGATRSLADHSTPVASAGVEAIVAEAMRDDTDLPLYVTCGAGLTQIASAWLIEPRIGPRLTLVWIGGSEHPGHADPPPGRGCRWSTTSSIDPIAAQVVFNESDIAIWQVPRNVYRTVHGVARRAARPHARRQERSARHLFDALGAVASDGGGARLPPRRDVHPRRQPARARSPPCSRRSTRTPRRARGSRCRAHASSTRATTSSNPDGRPIRVYTTVDTRLVLEDLYAKLALV